MKKIFTACLLFLTGCATPPVQNFYILDPCKGNEYLNSSTSEENLIKLFGRENISRAKGTEEGLSENGYLDFTIIYPETKNEFLVAWKEGESFKKPYFFSFYGSGTDWKLNNGVGTGTGIDSLIKLNGRNFTFTGFDWDMGGFADFSGGKLNTDCTTIRLDYNAEEENEITADETTGISGDVVVSSDNPVLRKLNVFVSEITILFRD